MKKKGVGYSAVISVTVTALLAGFLLSFAYSSFEKDIALNNEKAVLDSVRIAIPGVSKIDGPISDLADFPYYIGYNEDGSVAGYAFLASAKGYGGVNKVLVGFDAEIITITAAITTEHTETPGLGAKIAGKAFEDQFVGKSASSALVLTQGVAAEELGDSEVNGVTGATISSTSVIEAVNAARDEALSLFGAEDDWADDDWEDSDWEDSDDDW